MITVCSFGCMPGHAMQSLRQKGPFYGRKLYRLFSSVFGLFLVGVGVYVLLLPAPKTILQMAAGLVLVLLGLNLFVSALRAKESWLSRIGPLP
jgi:uncharacterized membrane protein HdeD (DUF308 family)